MSRFPSIYQNNIQKCLLLQPKCTCCVCNSNDYYCFCGLIIYGRILKLFTTPLCLTLYLHILTEISFASVDRRCFEDTYYGKMTTFEYTNT